MSTAILPSPGRVPSGSSLDEVLDIVGVDDIMAHLIDPDQAVEFVEKTGVDSLAVAMIQERQPGFPLVMLASDYEPDIIAS